MSQVYASLAGLGGLAHLQTQGFLKAQHRPVPRPPNAAPLRALWSLLVGMWCILRGGWGVLVYGLDDSLDHKSW